MKGKSMVTVMVGLLFLSVSLSIAEAAPGGVAECTNSLNMCTTGLAQAQVNLATCQTNAQMNLESCQVNLAECLATVEDCTLKAWSQKLDCSSPSSCPRFKVLSDWGNAAVLDKETCLVWEQSPSTSPVNWFVANFFCTNLNVADKRGWHLPTIEQLASLVDLTQSNPSLPKGHPFTNVRLSDYWSATTLAHFDAQAVYMRFTDGEASYIDKTTTNYVWCVRGGQSYDAY